MWNWLFNNSPPDKLTEVLKNLPALPLGLYLTLYCCIAAITLFLKAFGISIGHRIYLIYRLVTIMMTFHVFTNLGEYYSWLPEPEANSIGFGLDIQ